MVVGPLESQRPQYGSEPFGPASRVAGSASAITGHARYAAVGAVCIEPLLDGPSGDLRRRTAISTASKSNLSTVLPTRTSTSARTAASKPSFKPRSCRSPDLLGSQLCIAKIFADFDELAGKRAQALVLGDLRLCLSHGLCGDDRRLGLALNFASQGPARPVSSFPAGNSSAHKADVHPSPTNCLLN